MIGHLAYLVGAVVLAGPDPAGMPDGDPQPIGPMMTFSDGSGDEEFRRTDAFGVRPIRPTTPPIDLLSVTLSGWEPSPATVTLDPFQGNRAPDGEANIFRLDLNVAGVVNPPGQISFQVDGPHNPFEFGDRPLITFVEIDIDQNYNTGGEVGGAAELRWLANVGRFGTRPQGVLGGRVAESAFDYDLTLATPPQFERSGADFSLVMCGCSPVTIVERVLGDSDDTFEAGEVWIVESDFFQRAGGYACLSEANIGATVGEYAPPVQLRFAHNTNTNITRVSLVFALDAIGAGQLMGQPPVVPANLDDDHFHIQEAMEDVMSNVTAFLPANCLALSEDWGNGLPTADFLNPLQWRPTAIVGTAYDDSGDELYLWTDVGFNLVPFDVSGDGHADAEDAGLIQAFIDARDGRGPYDEITGFPDGQVVIPNFFTNFSIYDLNYDGVVNDADIALVTPEDVCASDVNGDGSVDIIDLLQFLNAWFMGLPETDLDANGSVDVIDLLAFLSSWFEGCI